MVLTSQRSATDPQTGLCDPARPTRRGATAQEMMRKRIPNGGQLTLTGRAQLCNQDPDLRRGARLVGWAMLPGHTGRDDLRTS